MAGGHSATDRAAMAKAVGDLDRTVGTIKGLQGQLGAHHEAVMAGWQGTASRAFNSAFSSFNEDMTKVNLALDRLRVSLLGNLKNYERNEQEQTDNATAIHKLLNGS